MDILIIFRSLFSTVLLKNLEKKVPNQKSFYKDIIRKQAASIFEGMESMEKKLSIANLSMNDLS